MGLTLLKGTATWPECLKLIPVSLYGRNTGVIKHLWYVNGVPSASFLPTVLSEVQALYPVE